jgi:hypothetical protein
MAAVMDWRTDQILTQHQSIPAAWADGDLPAVGRCANCADFFLAAIRFQRFRETRHFQAEPIPWIATGVCALFPKVGTPKWIAEQKLRAIVLKETEVPGPRPLATSGESFMFRRFVKERYLSMRQGRWSTR